MIYSKRARESPRVQTPSVGTGRITHRPVSSGSTSARHFTEEKRAGTQGASPEAASPPEMASLSWQPDQSQVLGAVNKWTEVKSRSSFSHNPSMDREMEWHASAKTYPPDLCQQVRSQSGQRDKWTHKPATGHIHVQSSLCRTSSPRGCTPYGMASAPPSHPCARAPLCRRQWKSWS
uniref:Uncharacterized protein n=1 Tax=Pipistrellus kuhlii TaxID=59472 RepID=A0A7J7RD62_PIPKU|nr:hypothetical protein mPipKuh1_010687 [Pipistrellus kuhlii]